ncbi:MAG TPA: exo-alpha-sialidase [Planctomycetota bacterium]
MRKLHVATRKGLFVLDRRGGTRPGWRISKVHFLGDPVSIVLPDPRDDAVYAGLDLGHFGCKLRRLDPGARKWKEMGVPTYPEKPSAQEIGWDDPTPWSLMKLWALESGGPDADGRLWAGTIPGGLFRSDDRGKSWELVRGLWNRPEREQAFGGGADHPALHSVCIDPRNSETLRVAISCGGVWTSRDLGTTWALTARGMRAAYLPPEQAYAEASQDPHMMVQCAAAPDTLWVQHHNGIFRSSDGARTWTEIEDVQPSSFGFAVAVHPKDPDTAWFVPAVKDECRVPVKGHMCVTRTRDGGRTFEQLRNGLPQRQCYDLVYRHAIDVTPDGDTLAIASTTGGLWITEDGGDTWKAASVHLPPVYALRFGA